MELNCTERGRQGTNKHQAREVLLQYSGYVQNWVQALHSTRVVMAHRL